MLKKLFILFIASSIFLFAIDYKISYKGIKMGIIKDISTIKDHYLLAKPDNFLVRWILGKDYLIFHDDEYTGKRLDNIKYKEDRHKIFFLINYLINNKLKQAEKKVMINEKDNKYIIVSQESDTKFKYTYYSHDKFRAVGEVILENGVLIFFKNKTKNIIIKQI